VGVLATSASSTPPRLLLLAPAAVVGASSLPWCPASRPFTVLEPPAATVSRTGAGKAGAAPAAPAACVTHGAPVF
jgi:hypothetical protein